MPSWRRVFLLDINCHLVTLVTVANHANSPHLNQFCCTYSHWHYVPFGISYKPIYLFHSNRLTRAVGCVKYRRRLARHRNFWWTACLIAQTDTDMWNIIPWFSVLMCGSVGKNITQKNMFSVCRNLSNIRLLINRRYHFFYTFFTLFLACSKKMLYLCRRIGKLFGLCTVLQPPYYRILTSLQAGELCAKM